MHSISRKAFLKNLLSYLFRNNLSQTLYGLISLYLAIQIKAELILSHQFYLYYILCLLFYHFFRVLFLVIQIATSGNSLQGRTFLKIFIHPVFPKNILHFRLKVSRKPESIFPFRLELSAKVESL